jgi:fucose permease
MENWKIKLSLFLNYFVFAILLNSVGIVILQVQIDYSIAEEAASVLEGYKDLSIAFFSFLVASYIPRFGYKKSMLAGLLFVTIGAIVMRLVGGFMMTKILFACVGVSFALIKVSVYSTVGLITKNSNEHSSFMNLLEGTGRNICSSICAPVFYRTRRIRSAGRKSEFQREFHRNGRARSASVGSYLHHRRISLRLYRAGHRHLDADIQ